MSATIGSPKFSEIKTGDQIAVSEDLRAALVMYERMSNQAATYSVSERQAQAATVVTKLYHSFKARTVTDKELLAQPTKSHAVKMHRRKTGSDLKAAVDYVRGIWPESVS